MNAPYLGLLVCLIYSYMYLVFFYFPFFFLASFKDMVFAISCINYVFIIVFSAFLQFWLEREQSSPRESHAVLVQATWRTEMLDNRL